MHASVMNENLKRVTVFEEEKGRMKMIITGCFKNYGQLEDQAAGMADVEAPGGKFLPVREFGIALLQFGDGLELGLGRTAVGIVLIGLAGIYDLDVLEADVLDAEIGTALDSA